MKKQQKIIIGIVITLLVITSGIFYFNSLKTHNSFFYDSVLGLVEITASKFNIFQQSEQTYFTAVGSNALKQTGTVNTQIQVNEYYLPMIVENSGGLYKAVILVAKDENWGSASQLDVTSAAKSVGSGGGIIYAKFTPSQPGTYTAMMRVFTNNDKYTAVYETSEYNREKIVISTSTTPSCTLTPRYGSWSTIRTIDGGRIQERTFYKIDITACKEVPSNTEDRIVCDSGYLVSGTSSTTADYTSQTCVKAQVVPDPECNADMTETCSDGTVITTKKCSNGIFVDSGSKCTVITPIVDNQTYQNNGTIVGGCGTVAPGNQDACCVNNNGRGFVWNGNSCEFMEEPHIGGGTTTEDKTQLIAWIVLGVIILLLLALGIKLALNRRR